jgi:hypothetical protein
MSEETISGMGKAEKKENGLTEGATTFCRTTLDRMTLRGTIDNLP